MPSAPRPEPATPPSRTAPPPSPAGFVIQLTAQLRLRPIEPRDDVQVARIIREVMPEFACSGQGFALHDAEVDAMSAAYPGGASQYWVVEQNGAVAGGAGFGPLAGHAPDERVCELRKMYFLRTLRGRRIGRCVLAFLVERMVEAGFRRVYLETTTQMTAARSLYERAGFREIATAMGSTGHHGCDRFYVLDLPPTDAGSDAGSDAGNAAT